MEEPQVSGVETIREALEGFRSAAARRQVPGWRTGNVTAALAALDALVAKLAEAERERDEARSGAGMKMEAVNL